MRDCLFSIFAHTKTHTHTVYWLRNCVWILVQFFIYIYFLLDVDKLIELKTKYNNRIQFSQIAKNCFKLKHQKQRKPLNVFDATVTTSVYEYLRVSHVICIQKGTHPFRCIYIYIRIYINECNRTREKQKRNQQTKLYSIYTAVSTRYSVDECT